MQKYAPEAAGGAFAQSREYYAELEEWLSGEDAGKLRPPDDQLTLKEPHPT